MKLRKERFTIKVAFTVSKAFVLECKQLVRANKSESHAVDSNLILMSGGIPGEESNAVALFDRTLSGTCGAFGRPQENFSGERFDDEKNRCSRSILNPSDPYERSLVEEHDRDFAESPNILDTRFERVSSRTR